eukprot:Polyplicarium_translucidae@DN3243_c0_g1_i4.p1
MRIFLSWLLCVWHVADGVRCDEECLTWRDGCAICVCDQVTASVSCSFVPGCEEPTVPGVACVDRERPFRHLESNSPTLLLPRSQAAAWQMKAAHKCRRGMWASGKLQCQRRSVLACANLCSTTRHRSVLFLCRTCWLLSGC